jgi:hypothetical protein
MTGPGSLPRNDHHRLRNRCQSNRNNSRSAKAGAFAAPLLVQNRLTK